MSKEIQVSASILCANFSKLGEEIKKCEKAGVDMLHVDVMDGHFVPNISIGKVVVESIRPVTSLPIETHLMIEHPWHYIEEFASAGADIISIHVECYGPRRPACREWNQYPKEVDSVDTERMLKDLRKIKALGKKAFAVVNPGTPLCFDKILDEVDGMLVMSVNPGFAKQKFMPVALDKIRDLRARFGKDIAVDGGVNGDTAPETVKMGANILATASYFFGSKEPSETVQFLKSLPAGV